MRDTQASTAQPAPGLRLWLWLWRWFWRVTLVVSLAYAWYCFYAPSNDIAWAKSYPSAQQQAAQADKPIILYFTGKWCVPCRIMRRQVWADEQVTATVNNNFVPVMIDVDHPDSAAVMARYKVVGPPVTIVTDPKGNVIDWRAGGLGKADFLNFLEQAKQHVSASSPDSGMGAIPPVFFFAKTIEEPDGSRRFR